MDAVCAAGCDQHTDCSALGYTGFAHGTAADSDAFGNAAANCDTLSFPDAVADRNDSVRSHCAARHPHASPRSDGHACSTDLGSPYGACAYGHADFSHSHAGAADIRAAYCYHSAPAHRNLGAAHSDSSRLQLQPEYFF